MNVTLHCTGLTALVTKRGFLTLADCCPELKVYQADEDNWDVYDQHYRIFTTYKVQSGEYKNMRNVYRSEDGKVAIAYDGTNWRIQLWENR